MSYGGQNYGGGQKGQGMQNPQQFSAQPGYLPGTPGDYGFFSMGNSRRMNMSAAPTTHPFAPGPGSPTMPTTPSSNPFLVGPGTPTSTPNPFGGPLNLTGSLGGGASASTNPFGGPLNMGSSFGATGAAGTGVPGGPGSGSGFTYSGSGGPSYQPTAPTGQPDPSSPEYAAYYYGLAPSTRAFMQAPGSAGAAAAYQSWLASASDPSAAHF